MRFRTVLKITVLVCMFSGGASSALAQQKGQWVPGQFGLNAGVIPDPGLTYANMALNYSASQLNGPTGNSIPGINGTYSFWVDENIIYYVPKHEFLGGYFMPYIALNYASGELVANITGDRNRAAGGGWVRFCRYVCRATELGWHLKHADPTSGTRSLAPTGRFTAGASNNVGSGYWGNNLTRAYLLHHQEQGQPPQTWPPTGNSTAKRS